ncbi:hypothetical protein COMA1_20344 [Candidatus Nitrospira nitrosa]|uniref:Uncharacterized protein n=1 Tax=Candidatus Nitrospira nitrosa TaxID=1742972 RepID=A0A0S4LCW6_9BACT|nr:hypothetical protein COMA1_20344 [Candidatus Nitrospira nitrosa]
MCVQVIVLSSSLVSFDACLEVETNLIC